MLIEHELSVKEQIIQTASRLFHQQGYNLTGINQIIEEAGVAKASLYYHFPSKEDLCVEYLRQRYDIWLSSLENHIRKVTDPEQIIIKTFEFRAIYLKRNQYSGCSYIKIICELPQRGEKIDNQVLHQKEKQRQFFREMVSKIDGMTKKKAASLADTIFLLFDGATVQCQVYRDSSPMEHAKKAVAELLVAHRSTVAI